VSDVTKQEFYLSDYKAQSVIHPPKKVLIFDTTLRDGEQTPGLTYITNEKIEIARKLDELGVSKIEAGFAIASDGEAEAIKRIAQEGLSSTILSLARPLKEDIDKVLWCDVPYIHIFISTSDLHVQTMMKTTREDVINQTINGIEYARSHGLRVEYSPQDATRTEMSFLIKACKAAEDAGAEMLNIPDTVGVMTPRQTFEFFSELKKYTRLPLSAHAHNDLGQAVANTLAAIEAGAEQAQVCVNGLGERAGNASLEQVAVCLTAQYKIETGLHYEKIAETSDLVQRLSGIYLPPTTPIVGDNAFAHESGIHVHGLLSHSGNYEILSPAFVGKTRRIVAGKHAGRHGIETMIQDMGLKPNKDQLKEIATRVKTLGDSGKSVTDTDLYAIAKNVMNIISTDRVKLKQLLVVTGNTIKPTASVVLEVDGKEYTGSGTGNGPIDSSINAIKGIVNSFADIKLDKFHMKAITGGTDAVADVTVHLSSDSRFVTASGVHGDTVMASVEAILKGMNQLMEKKGN